MRSETCIEGSFLTQMNFLYDLLDFGKELVYGKEDDANEDNARGNCEEGFNTFWRKIKYSKDKLVERKYKDYYEVSKIIKENIIMFELQLSQVSSKAFNQRESTGILDFLGDIGGFNEAIFISISFLG